MKVVPVHPDEEFVHHSVGPETVHLQSHQECAVGQFSIGPLGEQTRVMSKFISQRVQTVWHFHCSKHCSFRVVQHANF